jgi:hypothetical protein
MCSRRPLITALIVALIGIAWPVDAAASSADSTSAGHFACGWHVRFAHTRCHGHHFVAQAPAGRLLHRFFDDADSDNDGDDDDDDASPWLVQEPQSSAFAPVSATPGMDAVSEEPDPDAGPVAFVAPFETICQLRC